MQSPACSTMNDGMVPYTGQRTLAWPLTPARLLQTQVALEEEVQELGVQRCIACSQAAFMGAKNMLSGGAKVVQQRCPRRDVQGGVSKEECPRRKAREGGGGQKALRASM